MPEAIVTWIHRLTDPQRGVVAKRDGQQECPSVSVLAFGDGQSRGDHGRSGMHGRAFVDVVELENVRRDAVRQRRAGGGRSTRPKYDRLVGRPEARDDLLRHARRTFECARHGGAEPIENCAPGVGDD